MPDRAERLAEIVEEALERSGDARKVFLHDSCAGDAGLLGEVKSLLGQEATAQDFIETPLFRIDPEALAGTDGEAQRIGQIIGHHKILSLLGEGGMGEVYLAEDLELGRQVAIKLVRPGFGTRSLVRHFRAEERILAALNHPNIARLYGGGATADDVPYFVMEYVEGEPLDVYCSKRELPVEARLRLFQKVCAAVSYAHQHLVIHRDLKPANIRVTAEGEPKLLDFGIAQLLDAEAATGPAPTMTLAGMMTPDYASPEHVRGESMTTASDIYSLGVVLYELLTGQKPYRLTSRHPSEISRAITDQEPTRPSAARGASLQLAERNAAQRAGSKLKSRVTKSLVGDLDNIVLMALRKEPARRYASVGQFSEDVGRHLSSRPVIARKDTWGYRSAKFVRRNKLGVAAAAFVFLSLLGGIVAARIEAQRAQQQRARAERRFDEVRRLANSLMFEIHDSVQDLQGSTPTRRLIVTRALEYLDSLAQEGSENPTLQRELATAYEKIGDIQGNPYSANLGDTEGALASYRKALAIREHFAGRKTSAETQIGLGRSFRGLGDIFEQKGDIAQTIENYRHSLSIFEQLAATNPNDEAVQDELARAYETLGEGLGRTEAKEERADAYRKTLEIRRHLLASHPEDTKLRRSTGLAFLKVGSVVISSDKTESLNDLRLGTELLEAFSAEHPNDARARREVGMAYYFTGTALTEAGEYDAALEARRKALVIRQEIAEEDPKNKQAQFDLAGGHGDLSEAYTKTGAPNEAFAEGEQSLAILEALTGSDPTNAIYQRNLGLCYERLAEAKARTGVDQHDATAWNEARTWYRKALDLFSSLEQHGTLMPSDAGQVAKFRARLGAADEAIAQLNP